MGKKNPSDYLSQLINTLCQEVKNEEDPVLHLLKLVWLRDLCNLTAEGRGGIPLDFLKSLVQGGIYREIKTAVCRYFESLMRKDTDPLINEVKA